MADVTITFTMTLKPEAVDGVCSGLPEMIKDTAMRPGFRNIRIVQNEDNPAQLLFIETWESEQAYRDYIAWRTDRGEMDSFASTLASEPVIQFWPTLVAAI